MSQNIKLLCIGGMHGHGHYALRSLFDGHPDVIAYPFFMANLFRYWRYGSLSSLRADRLVEAVWPLVNNDAIFEANIGVTKDDIGFDDQKVKAAFANEIAQLPPDQPVSLPDLLFRLIRGFHKTSSKVQTDDPKYYAFEVDCREFPWSDAAFLSQVKHVLAMRDSARSYLNHRADFLDRHGWGLPRFLFFRAPLELSQGIYNWTMLRAHMGHPNLIVFPFESMRVDPEATMREAAQILGIEYKESLIYLTRNGVSEHGFTTDGQKSNKIVAQGGRYLIPMTKSEEALFYGVTPVFDWKNPQATENVKAKSSFLSLLSLFSSESIRLPIFILSAFWELKLGDSVLRNQWQLLQYAKTKALAKPDVTAIGLTKCRTHLLRLAVLRFLSFLGLAYALLINKIFGGKLLLWPHLILLIRLGIYHRLERSFKNRAALRKAKYESL